MRHLSGLEPHGAFTLREYDPRVLDEHGREWDPIVVRTDNFDEVPASVTTVVILALLVSNLSYDGFPGESVVPGAGPGALVDACGACTSSSLSNDAGLREVGVTVAGQAGKSRWRMLAVADHVHDLMRRRSALDCRTFRAVGLSSASRRRRCDRRRRRWESCGVSSSDLTLVACLIDRVCGSA